MEETLAYLDSQNGFDIRFINFNLIFRNEYMENTDPVGGAHPEVTDFTIGKISVSVPDHSVSFATTYAAAPFFDYGNFIIRGQDFTFTDGVPVSGTVQALSLSLFPGGDDIYAFGLSLDVAAVMAATRTATIKDDSALVRKMLTGNDLIILYSYDDEISTGAGKDFVRAGAGNDTIFGEGGSDLILGGIGADVLRGGNGADILFGGSGADRLVGGLGADTLVGGTGNDILIGNAGADRFVFSTGDGNDHIQGFTLIGDRIVIQSGATSFADLTITQEGANAKIAFGNVTITLDVFDATKLGAGSFLFADALPANGLAETATQTWLVGWDYLA